MGESFAVVVDVEATLDEARALGDGVLRWLVAEGIVEPTPPGDLYRPGTNHARALGQAGAPGEEARTQVEVGRRVFFPVGGAPGPAACPRCHYPVVLTDPETGLARVDWEAFSDALTDWHDGGAGAVRCPSCGSAVTINEWHWQGEWPVAVGHLGVIFWNWPPLAPAFVREVGEQLGHRVVATHGAR